MLDTARCIIHMLVCRVAVNRQMFPIVLVCVAELAETRVSSSLSLKLHIETFATLPMPAPVTRFEFATPLVVNQPVASK